jgi:hypothetical protein
MNFGIADIDQQFGGHKRRYVCGMMIDSRNQSSCQYPKEDGLPHGNGCYLNPADLDKLATETGCFTCIMRDCVRTDYRVRKHKNSRCSL